MVNTSEPVAEQESAVQEFIEVFGAREHNLKNIDIRIPKNKLVVFTGVSGSGKSSLAFDTIYNEGQRRYMESFSAYARQFIGDMERPDVDKITGGVVDDVAKAGAVFVANAAGKDVEHQLEIDVDVGERDATGRNRGDVHRELG